MSGTEPANPAAVIELRGELDITVAALLGAALTRAVARTPVIEVDLTPRRSWPAAALPYWVMKWTV